MSVNSTISLNMASLEKTRLLELAYTHVLEPQKILACVLVLILTKSAWRRFFSPLKDIPGPFWASITRLWMFKIIFDGDQNERIKQLHDRHGKFVRTSPNEISITHPDAVKKLLLTPLHKGSFYDIANIPDWRFKTPMSARNPKEKIERSKTFASGYVQSNVIKYEEAIDRMIGKLLGWIVTYAESGKPMKLDEFINFTTFDVVGEVLFSKEFGFLEKGYDVENTIHNNVMLEKVGVPLTQYRWMLLMLSNPIVTTLGLSPSSMVRRIALECLQERKKNPDARFDVVAHWLRYLEQHPDRTTWRNVEAQTTANIGAGSDTVSCGIQSTIYHMIRNPETWAKAREEIEAARREDRCEGKVVSYADTQQLPYLQACIKEGLRINSPVPMFLPRIAPKGGVQIGDQHLPEGTTVSINPWVFHREKDVWGQDADKFKPERWLVEDAARLDKYFIPFGVGYMSCPGQHIARMELSKICSTVVRDYDLKLEDPSKSWKLGAYFIMCVSDWPVLVKKAGS